MMWWMVDVSKYSLHVCCVSVVSNVWVGGHKVSVGEGNESLFGLFPLVPPLCHLARKCYSIDRMQIAFLSTHLSLITNTQCTWISTLFMDKVADHPRYQLTDQVMNRCDAVVILLRV